MIDPDFDFDSAVAEIVRSIGPIPIEQLDPSWSRVDLADALAGAVTRVTPAVFARDDGAHLFYRGRVNGVHGDSGTGKSMVLAVAAAQELNGGRHVGWVDLEDPDPTTIIERLRMFGVADDTIHDRLHYYSPQVPFSDLAVAALVADTIEHAFTLLVVDSMGEAFGLDGLDENKDTDVGPWMRRNARVLADAGPAVALVDHSTKAADNALHPSGSKRKRAAITGASYLLDVTRPLTREDGGRLRLTCAKDRHGSYRRGDVAAVVDFHVYPDGGINAKVWAPLVTDSRRDAQARLHTVANDAIRAVKDAGRPLTQNELEQLMALKGSHDLKRAGIAAAVAQGALRTEEGAHRAVLHVYVRDLEPTAPDCAPTAPGAP